MTLYPDNQDYKLYYAQSLYKVSSRMQHGQDGARACRAYRAGCSKERGCCHHVHDVDIKKEGLDSHRPNVPNVRPCHCRRPSFAQAGMYAEASREAVKVEGHTKPVTMLLIANSYEQDDLVGELGQGVQWWGEWKCCRKPSR